MKRRRFLALLAGLPIINRLIPEEEWPGTMAPAEYAHFSNAHKKFLAGLKAPDGPKRINPRI